MIPKDNHSVNTIGLPASTPTTVFAVVLAMSLTMSSSKMHTKLPKIPYRDFLESIESDQHIPHFKVMEQTNGAVYTTNFQCIFGTTLQGNHIKWYIDFESKHVYAKWER